MKTHSITKHTPGVSVDALNAPSRPYLSQADLALELVAILHHGGDTLASAADQIAHHEDRARVILDRTRTLLFQRLLTHSDDIDATNALRAVYSASARLTSNADPAVRERFVHSGLSGSDRARTWLWKWITWPSQSASRRRRHEEARRDRP